MWASTREQEAQEYIAAIEEFESSVEDIIDRVEYYGYTGDIEDLVLDIARYKGLEDVDYEYVLDHIEDYMDENGYVEFDDKLYRIEKL